MLSAIVVNALVITVLSFPHLMSNGFLITIDTLFVLLFVLEAIVKISHYGLKNYFSDSWNIFDFSVVVLSLPAFLSLIMPFPDFSSVLLLRLLRLVRLIRFLDFIPHMRQLLKGLSRAFKASIFVLGALAAFNLLLGVVACNIFQEVSPKYFGDPILSSYTIFQMFTLEGWSQIAEELAEGINGKIWGGLARLFFVVVVISGGIFGLSLANAVFVDEMTIDNNEVLEEKIDELTQKIAELSGNLQNKE